MKAMETSDALEGPAAFENFKRAMQAVVKVPHSVIQKRVEEHRKQVAKNPNRRGPKPKRKAPPAVKRDA